MGSYPLPRLRPPSFGGVRKRKNVECRNDDQFDYLDLTTPLRQMDSAAEGVRMALGLTTEGLLRTPFIIGGRSAFEVQVFAHYLSHEVKTIHLYGQDKWPSWLQKPNLPQRFVYHNSTKLLRGESITLVIVATIIFGARC